MGGGRLLSSFTFKLRSFHAILSTMQDCCSALQNSILSDELEFHNMEAPTFF